MRDVKDGAGGTTEDEKRGCVEESWDLFCAAVQAHYLFMFFVVIVRTSILLL